MADPVSIKIQGTTVTYDAVAVGGVDTVEFSGATLPDLNQTTVASTFTQKLPGLLDLGTAKMNFSRRNPDDLGQAAMWTDLYAGGPTKTVVFTLPTATLNVVTFTGYVSQMTGINAQAAGLVTGSATITLQSAPVLS